MIIGDWWLMMMMLAMVVVDDGGGGGGDSWWWWLVIDDWCFMMIDEWWLVVEDVWWRLMMMVVVVLTMTVVVVMMIMAMMMMIMVVVVVKASSITLLPSLPLLLIWHRPSSQVQAGHLLLAQSSSHCPADFVGTLVSLSPFIRMFCCTHERSTQSKRRSGRRSTIHWVHCLKTMFLKWNSPWKGQPL